MKGRSPKKVSDTAFFRAATKRILGARYDLSFSFVGPTAIARMNRAYRQKDAATDILAFPLDDERGEIVICKSASRMKAKSFGMAPQEYLRFLFIHGCLHLKGHDHGRIMEKLERVWCGRFRIPLPKY